MRVSCAYHLLYFRKLKKGCPIICTAFKMAHSRYLSWSFKCIIYGEVNMIYWFEPLIHSTGLLLPMEKITVTSRSGCLAASITLVFVSDLDFFFFQTDSIDFSYCGLSSISSINVVAFFGNMTLSVTRQKCQFHRGRNAHTLRLWNN